MRGSNKNESARVPSHARSWLAVPLNIVNALPTLSCDSL